MVISATNRDLESLSKKGKFREDLFYRLNTFTIHIPSLKERQEDIFELTEHYLQVYNKEFKQKKRISAEAIQILQSYPFAGNVRELKNIIKKAVVMSEGAVLDDTIFKTLGKGIKQQPYTIREKNYILGLNEELDAVEKEILKTALKYCRTTREMAGFLRVSQTTVIRRLRKHGLS